MRRMTLWIGNDCWMSFVLRNQKWWEASCFILVWWVPPEPYIKRLINIWIGQPHNKESCWMDTLLVGHWQCWYYCCSQQPREVRVSDRCRTCEYSNSTVLALLALKLIGMVNISSRVYVFACGRVQQPILSATRLFACILLEVHLWLPCQEWELPVKGNLDTSALYCENLISPMILCLDISNPTIPSFVSWLNTIHCIH